MSGIATRTKFQKVTHVLFDMDGVLLDTESIYTVVTNNIVKHYGKTFDWTIKSQLMGLLPEESAKTLVDLLDLPISWQEYSALAQEQCLLLMPHCNLMPDTEPLYASAIRALAGKYGQMYSPDIRVKVLGIPGIETSRILVADLKLPISVQQCLKEYREYCRLMFRSCSLMPGAEKLVKHLFYNNIPIALATSSVDEHIEMKTSRHKHVFDLFHHVVNGSDPEVKWGKPNPDIFLVCASRFPDKPKPEQCLVIEDAPNGVAAAVRAGMQCVMVPDSHLPSELTTGATQIINSLEEIKLEDFGLPFLDII